MMRVTLVANISGSGGVWRHITDLADGLRAKGCAVALALPTRAVALRREADAHGCEVFELNFSSLAKLGPMAQSSPSIVHFHLADTYDRWTLPALALARMAGHPTIVTEHLPRSDASDPTAMLNGKTQSIGAWPAKTALKRAQFALCHRVVCVSDSSIRFLMTRYGVNRAKAVVIPNGILVGDEPSAPTGSPPTFVAIGAAISQKGFDVLLDAAALARESWQVRVIGDGPHVAALRRSAATRALPVTFVGPLCDIQAELTSALGLVVPSRWEAWPYVALEAMERGRAVVASRVDGLPEIVTHGVTGVIIEPNDPQSLAVALDRLALEPAFTWELGKEGRRRVKSFGLDAMVHSLLEVYETALRAGGRRAVTHA